MKTLYDYMNILNWDPPTWAKNVNMPKKPFPHQLDDLKFFNKFTRFGLLSEPGTGKTLPIQAQGACLAACKNKVVYIMPPILLNQFYGSFRDNYQGIEEYLTIEILRGTPKQRDKLTGSWDSSTYPDILLMSFSMFTIYHEILKAVGYAMLFIDEATAVKNTSSKIHKAVHNFVNAGNGLALVTGTPIETNVEDCYGLIRLLTPTAYSSKANFEFVHVVKEFAPPHMAHMAKTLGYKNVDLLNYNLYAQSRRVRKKDVSDLPPRLITEYLVDLTPAHKSLYREIIEERLVEVGDELLDMTTSQALYQATQQVLLNPEKFGKVIKDNALFEMLDSVVQILDSRKIIVYAWYNDSVDTICNRYKHLNPAKINGTVTGVRREAEKQKFIHDNTCKMVVSNPKSGGVGIDGFQDICSHVIYAEVCAQVGTFYQSIDRVHRRGQKATTVNIYLLVAKDTVAVKLRNNLVKKDEWNESVTRDKRTVLAELMGSDGISGSFDLGD